MARWTWTVAIALSLGTLLVRSAGAADWPTYRADAARSGYSPDALPGSLGLRWTYRLGHPPRPAWPTSARMPFDFAAQPIVVGRTVLAGSSADDRVVALDVVSGEERWSFFTEGPIRFAPAAWRDRVFVASDDGYLYALALSDGRLLWKYRGGPNDRKCLGNERMISRWPARGGPVVFDNTVYFAAGIWPSDGIYLHALDAATGSVIWTNGETGRIQMPQPHGGANAASGVSPQGYLLATQERLFVPTGRAVPAAFVRQSGKLEYYRLQENGSIGGSRAMLADRFVVNAGCFLERRTGKLAGRAGRGVLTSTSDGLLQSTGATLVGYRWADLERTNRRGKAIRYRGLNEFCRLKLGEEQEDSAVIAERLQPLKNLYAMNMRFKEVFDTIPQETGLERTLSQTRPKVASLGMDADRFLATSYEKTTELIVAGEEAVCGGPGVVSVVNLPDKAIRWSHPVEGTALGLAASAGRLIVSTTDGVIYCFDDGGEAAPKEKHPSSTTPILPDQAPAPSDQAPAPSDQAPAPPDLEPAPPDLEVDYAKAAVEILRISGVTDGYCVDLGGGSGQLALELVSRSNLRVCVVEPDEAKAAATRRRLHAAGLYGTRVVVHTADPAHPPYPKWFADLIVSSAALAGREPDLPEQQLERLRRPAGGVICIGTPGKMEAKVAGPLAGAGSWTHQNANPANTLSSDDWIAGPLEMLWFRDGVIEIPDRHAQAPAPLVHRGTLVVEGVDGLCGLDAYNGRTLWTFAVKGILADQDGVHHDVGVGDTGGNFCLTDDSVYVRTEDQCFRLDLRTGRQLGRFTTPVPPEERNRAWGYVACEDGVLYGSVLNDKHTVSPRYDDVRLRTESVLFFAMDAKTGQLKWKYQPEHSIRNNAIAVAGGRVYLIDRTLAMLDRITRPDRDHGKHRPAMQPGTHPGGVLIAFDGATGELLWKQDGDVWGTQLAVSEKHGLVLMYYQAVKHGFFKLPTEIGGRLAAFDASTGARVWDIEAEFVTRPILNGDRIYAEGGAWDVRSGKPIPWRFERSYGCGQIVSGRNLMLFRSATLGYLDLTRDVGIENFGGTRPSCWFSAVPAAGLVLVPDGSLKCACSYQMQAWFALTRREE